MLDENKINILLPDTVVLVTRNSEDRLMNRMLASHDVG
jgi:hypothetical protein